ncbi:PREDICTED: uncharacterized protein LOC101368815 [Odobenus rosmarus divergens]|uniref:Uncharacterized protein LOC101368815 n=1 Tax=Odobenus rosmarus divergens TaxID=9708 RepID=A0A9B0GFF4_ODORO
MSGDGVGRVSSRRSDPAVVGLISPVSSPESADPGPRWRRSDLNPLRRGWLLGSLLVPSPLTLLGVCASSCLCRSGLCTGRGSPGKDVGHTENGEMEEGMMPHYGRSEVCPCKTKPQETGSKQTGPRWLTG